MLPVIQGSLLATTQRFALIASRFNELVTGRLMAGAVDALRRHGVEDARITQVWVPGAWELPLAAKTAAASGRFEAVVCLGCVIRGQTPHFDYVAGQAARGIAQASFDTGIPIGFGVLTTDSMEQALDRAGGKAGNKGAEAAMTVIEMCGVLAALRAGSR